MPSSGLYERLRILGEPAAYTAKELEALRSENEFLQARIERLESRVDSYGTPRKVIEALRAEGLVYYIESENQDIQRNIGYPMSSIRFIPPPPVDTYKPGRTQKKKPES